LSLPIFALRFFCGTLFSYMSTTHELADPRSTPAGGYLRQIVEEVGR